VKASSTSERCMVIVFVLWRLLRAKKSVGRLQLRLISVKHRTMMCMINPALLCPTPKPKEPQLSQPASNVHLSTHLWHTYCCCLAKSTNLMLYITQHSKEGAPAISAPSCCWTTEGMPSAHPLEGGAA
jgi:hypothetical protein